MAFFYRAAVFSSCDYSRLYWLSLARFQLKGDNLTPAWKWKPPVRHDSWPAATTSTADLLCVGLCVCTNYEDKLLPSNDT